MASLESIKSLTIKPPFSEILSPRIPWEDVCMAMAYCSREASAFGRLKYALDPTCHSKVWNALFKVALKIKWYPNQDTSYSRFIHKYIDNGGNATQAARYIGASEVSAKNMGQRYKHRFLCDKKKPAGVSKELLSRVSRLALEESVSPACCPSCSGRGKFFIEDKMFECLSCQGIGRKAISDRMRCEFLGVEKNEFKNNISYNYHNFILGKTYEWERELIVALRRLDENEE